MVTYSGQDKYNPSKYWEAKRYKCGHYYITQYVFGTKFGTGKRVSIQTFKEIVKNIK